MQTLECILCYLATGELSICLYMTERTRDGFGYSCKTLLFSFDVLLFCGMRQKLNLVKRGGVITVITIEMGSSCVVRLTSNLQLWLSLFNVGITSVGH